MAVLNLPQLVTVADVDERDTGLSVVGDVAAEQKARP
jgi:hypothetical protein